MGIPGSPNPLLMRKAAAAADDGSYQIERSLRFNDPDSPYLKKVFSSVGNTRKWTFSCWIKLAHPTEDAHLLGAYVDTNNRDNFYLGGDNWFGFNMKNNGSWHVDKVTDMKFKDTNAWQHLVIRWDTLQGQTKDRARFYVNGKEVTWGGGLGVTDPAQNAESIINQADSIFYIGAGPNNDGSLQSSYWGGMISDAQFIDGLSLSPASFGSFDSANNWNPRSLTLPSYNDGTTWSSSVSGAVDSASYSHDKLFDGYLGSAFNSTLHGNNVFTYPASNTTNTFTPSSPIVAKQQIRVWAYRYDAFGQFWWNGIDHTDTMKNVLTAHGSVGWVEMPTRTLTSMAWRWVSGVGIPYMGAIEVDGVILIDGKTDATNYNNPNDGRTWSDYLTATGGINDADRTFNGLVPNAGSAGALTYGVSQGGTMTFAPTGGIVYKDTVELYTDQGSTYTVNGGSSQTFGPSTGQSNGIWYTVATGGGTLTSLTWTPQNASYYPSSAAMRIDGHILIDSTVDNGFHLKFNDTATTSTVGKDSRNGKIADATGGLPIYNTDDDYGDVKGTGNRTDSDSANLKLAIAGDAFTDSSGNSVNVSATNATISKAQSRFYGSSINFDVSTTNQHVTTGTGLWSANGDATFEAWLWVNDFNQNRTIMHTADAASGDSYSDISIMTDKQIRIHPTSSNAIDTPSVVPLQQWFHLALVQSSSDRKVYINGIAQTMTTVAGNANTAAWHEATETMYIGEENMRYFYSGYMNDIRVYDKQKYTANFQPPTRNEFTVHNLAGGPKNYTRFWTGTGPIAGNNGGCFAYNSTTSSGDHGSGGTGTHIVWTPSPAITINHKARVYMSQGSASQCTINGSSFTTAAGWNDITSHCSGTLSTFRLDAGAGSAWAKVWQIEIDGEILKDTSVFTDSPSNSGEDTGAGGEVTGNFCTWNPLMIGDSTTQTFSEGNLEWKNDGADAWTGGTLGVKYGSSDTNKWYWEVTVKHGKGGYGICTNNNKDNDHTSWGGGTDRARIYLSSNGKLSDPAGGSDLTYGSNTTCVVGDTVGVALDLSPGGSNGTITFYKNGTSLGQAHSDIDTSKYWTVFANDYGENPVGGVLNTGQTAFKYAAPTDHKCLCTANFKDTFGDNADTNNPSKYCDATVWVGDGSSPREISMDNGDFTPDLVWLKNRTTAGRSHYLYDAVRTFAAQKELVPNSTDEEGSSNHQTQNHGYVSAVGDGTFTLGSGATNQEYTNKDGDNFFAWNWDAGTAAATASTDGTITPDAQWVNATAGFSITKYTGTAANATVGHGLNAAPDLMIHKMYSENSDWQVWHGTFSGTQFLQLTNSAIMTQADMWNSTVPTNTVFHLGNGNGTNKSGADIMMYCWTAIPGYSAFGSYTGNANAEGPFVYLGFRPRMVIFKNTNTTNGWRMQDTAVNTYNPLNTGVYPNQSSVEDSPVNWTVDYLSNGFKIRDSNNELNGSGNKIIYMAWAENPFKTSRAR